MASLLHWRRLLMQHGQLTTANPSKAYWLPLDVMVHGTNAALGLGVVLVARHNPQAWQYLALHALVAAMLLLIASHDVPGAQRTNTLRFLHHWLPVAFVLTMYFELGVLIPELREYSDHRYDRALQALDVWLLGDPVNAISHCASRALSELLTVCYFAYYPLVIAVPLAVYVRGSHEDFQRVASVIFVAFVLSYIGYLLWPAVGPHRLFDAYRPAALDGYGLAHHAYQFLHAVPSEPPDAFPSGHALLGVLVPALARRYYRPLFAWLAPIGVGIVFATVYLRLHYIADVVAGIALAPVAWGLGRASYGWLSRRIPEQEPAAAGVYDERIPLIQTQRLHD